MFLLVGQVGDAFGDSGLDHVEHGGNEEAITAKVGVAEDDIDGDVALPE